MILGYAVVGVLEGLNVGVSVISWQSLTVSSCRQAPTQRCVVWLHPQYQPEPADESTMQAPPSVVLQSCCQVSIQYAFVGASVGSGVGVYTVGYAVGCAVGVKVGSGLGDIVGIGDGTGDGPPVGVYVG